MKTCKIQVFGDIINFVKMFDYSLKVNYVFLNLEVSINESKRTSVY